MSCACTPILVSVASSVSASEIKVKVKVWNYFLEGARAFFSILSTIKRNSLYDKLTGVKGVCLQMMKLTEVTQKQNLLILPNFCVHPTIQPD